MTAPTPTGRSEGRAEWADDPLRAKPFRSYAVGLPYPTRWSDNDMYGHLNNAKYYELFDTAINTWVAKAIGADFVAHQTIGVVAESGCRFHAELAFPDTLTVGLRIQRLGRSSITYDLGLFSGSDPSAGALAAATARWVHVYLSRSTRSTTAVPAALRAAAARLNGATSTGPPQSPARTQRPRHPGHLSSNTNDH